jgi:hypothetical protein
VTGGADRQLRLLGEIAETLTDVGVPLWSHVALEFEKEGESIQVLLVDRNAAGVLVVHGYESWPFPEGALGGPRRLENVVCRTLTPHALLYEKETYEANKRRPPREKDLSSIELLRKLATEG